MTTQIPSISNPSTLPPIIRASPIAVKIWGALERHARAALLVHGSRVYELPCFKDCTDPQRIIAEMVEHGALKPIKCDWASTNMSHRAFLGLQYGSERAAKREAEKQWNMAFACCWTYEPGNRSPLPWTEE